MARTDLDGWMHACTTHAQHKHIHQTETVTTMSCSPQGGSTKMTLRVSLIHLNSLGSKTWLLDFLSAFTYYNI